MKSWFFIFLFSFSVSSYSGHDYTELETAVNKIIHKSLRRTILFEAKKNTHLSRHQNNLIMSAYAMFDSDGDLLGEIKEILNNYETLTIYECNGGNIAFFVAEASVGACIGYEFHRDGTLRMMNYAQAGLGVLFGIEFISYEDREIRKGGVIAGFNTEFSVGIGLTIIRGIGLDIVDLEFGNNGETDRFIDAKTGWGYGGTVIGVEDHFNIPWGDIVEVTLAKSLI
jgi:hypothetical protein